VSLTNQKKMNNSLDMSPKANFSLPGTAATVAGYSEANTRIRAVK